MKFAKGKYNAKQRKWCQMFEDATGFDPHEMGNYEAGNMTFVEAAKRCIHWFEDWSSDTYLRVSGEEIPGEDIYGEEP